VIKSLIIINLNTDNMEKKPTQTVGSLINEIKRRTRRKFNSEEKIRIVMEGVRGEESIAEICRKHSIHVNMYYKWSKEFMEAGRKRLHGDTIREATTSEVVSLRKENAELKELVAELSLQTRVLKKSISSLE
jgi:transposase